MKNPEGAVPRASHEVQDAARVALRAVDIAVLEMYPHAEHAARISTLAQAAVVAEQQSPDAQIYDFAAAQAARQASAEVEAVAPQPAEALDEGLLRGAGAEIIHMADYPLEQARRAVAIATGQTLPMEGDFEDAQEAA